MAFVAPRPAPPCPHLPRGHPLRRLIAAPPRRPADVTVRYDILFGDNVAGKSVVVRHADGSYDEDYEFNDRGRGPKIHTHGEIGPDGLPTRLELSGKDYFKRDVRELATCDTARCKWDSNDEHGEGPRAFYSPNNPTSGIDGPLLAAALRSGGAVSLLPAGVLRARKAIDATVAHAGQTKHLSVYELSGVGFTPTFEWFEDDGTSFAQSSARFRGERVREGLGRSHAPVARAS